MRHRHLRLLTVPLLVLAAAGCAAPHATAPVGVASSTATPSEVTVTASPDPVPTDPPTASTTPTAGCAPSTLTIVKGTPPTTVCLAVGADLNLTSEASPLQPWSALNSSDPTVLSCQSTSHPDGSITATCHAHKPGRATLTTLTAPFAGDPHGPPQYQWQLTVTVPAN